MKKCFCGFSMVCVLFTLNLQGQEENKWEDWLRNKQFHQILARTDSLTRSDSTDIRIMRTIGEAYEGFLDYKKAYQTYQYCLTLDTVHPDLLTTLGRTALSLGKLPDAERYFKQVLEQDSSNFFARYQLAQLNYQTGNYGEAVNELEILQRQYPENAMVQYELGNCCVKLQDPVSAFFAYSYAFGLNKENPLFASSVANIMLRNGKTQAKEALNVCDTALFYNPNNRTLLQYKGMGYYINDDYLQADTIYTKLLAAGDSSYMTLKYGGASRYYAGLYFDSIGLLEKAYQEDTTSAEVCMLLGSALGKTYDRQRAYALFKQAEENMKPPKWLVKRLAVFRAETLEKDGKRDQAALLYYQFWKDDPSSGFSFLEKLSYYYSRPAVYQYTDDKQRQQGLFINYLLAKEWLRTKKDSANRRMNRRALESFYDYMQKNKMDEFPTIAPDSTSGSVTIDSLKSVLDRLPVIEKKAEQESGAEKYALEMYRRWKKNPKDISMLYYLVLSAYRATDQAYITREEDRGLILYLNYLYASEWLKKKKEGDRSNTALPEEVPQLLRSFYDYMVANQLEELTLYSPEKNRSALKLSDLKEVTDELQ